MSKSCRCAQLGISAAWIVAFVAYFWFAIVRPSVPLKPDAKPLGALQLHSGAGQYRELPNAAEFGLEKLFSLLNYLLVAAAALLAFIAKPIVDLRFEYAKQFDKKPSRPLSRMQLRLFLHAGIACFFSMTWGVVAYVSMPGIAVRPDFSITGVMSRCMIGQVLGLAAAVVLMLVALGQIVSDLVTSSSNATSSEGL